MSEEPGKFDIKHKLDRLLMVDVWPDYKMMQAVAVENYTPEQLAHMLCVLQSWVDEC